MAIRMPHKPRNLSVRRKLLTVITIALTWAALIMASLIPGWPPAGADPSPGSGDPNLFGGLSCICSETTPADGPARSQQIRRGIQQGLSVGQRD